MLHAVYIVFYDDYGSGPAVMAAFSTIEKANKWIDRQCEEMIDGELMYDRDGFSIEGVDIDGEDYE